MYTLWFEALCSGLQVFEHRLKHILKSEVKEMFCPVPLYDELSILSFLVFVRRLPQLGFLINSFFYGGNP